MSREIKFRAWQSQEEKMYVQKDAVDENRKVFWNIWENKSHISDPMQFTGKEDASGKEIYEHDYVDAYKPNSKLDAGDICEVVWSNDFSQWVLLVVKSFNDYRVGKVALKSNGQPYLLSNVTKVLGNKYQTPELTAIN